MKFKRQSSPATHLHMLLICLAAFALLSSFGILGVKKSIVEVLDEGSLSALERSENPKSLYVHNFCYLLGTFFSFWLFAYFNVAQKCKRPKGLKRLLEDNSGSTKTAQRYLLSSALFYCLQLYLVLSHALAPSNFRNAESSLGAYMIVNFVYAILFLLVGFALKIGKATPLLIGAIYLSLAFTCLLKLFSLVVKSA